MSSNSENIIKQDNATSFNAQSPIDINTSSVLYNENLKRNPLNINYSSLECDTILNVGHTFEVRSSNDNSVVENGPVESSYKFLQLHWHWNENNNGSEHLIDGNHYAAEIHFVNWNYKQYENPAAAAQSNKHDGLVVLGVLVDIQENDNKNLNELIDGLEKIKFKGNSHKLATSLNINNLLPNDLSSYYTYKGSLTTKPFSESVTWIVFDDPIYISKKQLSKLQLLYDSSECCEDKRIKANNRNVFDLKNRPVYSSFPYPTNTKL